MQIRALQAIIADLHNRPGPGADQALGYARALLLFYRRLAQRADVLTGDQEPNLAPRPARPRREPKRERAKKAFSPQFTLAVLREADGPLTAAEIRRRLAVVYKPLGRQAVAYALKRLLADGRVTRSKCNSRSGRRLTRSESYAARHSDAREYAS